MKFDDTDIQLLKILQEDAKVSVKDLAKKLHKTKSPIYERIRRYEEMGLIERYVAILNSEMMAGAMVAFCSVSLESQNLEAIQAFSSAIQNIPEVMDCYLMGGANDFLLKVVVKDLNAYHHFSSGKLAALPNVAQIKSTFVLHRVKKSTAYPIFVDEGGVPNAFGH